MEILSLFLGRLADPREHVLKAALGDAPVAYTQSRSVPLHRVVEFLCSETLEGDLKCVLKSEYYLIDKVSVEFSYEDGGGDLLRDEVSHSSHYDDIIEIAVFFRENFIIIV